MQCARQQLLVAPVWFHMSMEISNSMSLTNLRVGKCYFIQNYGETTSFMVLEAHAKDDFKIKDLLTMEIYPLSHLTRYGMGNDFEIRELDCN